MTALFDRIKPAQKFRISKREIAKFLGIAESLIKEVKKWPYVIFVHRADRGGQFVSYRKIERWRNAVACQIQKCVSLEELQQLGNAIRRDWKKHKKQYEDVALRFLERIWQQRRESVLQLAKEDGLESANELEQWQQFLLTRH
ncbi:MAG: hypothetical protein U7127_25865 [Phormidium sp.]